MKKYIFLILAMIGMANFAYASFPVVDDARGDFLVDNPGANIPTKEFNWEAYTSLTLAVLGAISLLFISSYLASFFFLLGFSFGLVSILGNKRTKWLGWMEMFANLFWLVLTQLGIILIS